MTATILKPQASPKGISIAVLPSNVPVPVLPLFSWVEIQGDSGYSPDEEETEWVEYKFTDRGQIIGIQWDGEDWIYKVEFDPELSENFDESGVAVSEYEDDFYAHELTPIADPTISQRA